MAVTNMTINDNKRRDKIFALFAREHVVITSFQKHSVKGYGFVYTIKFTDDAGPEIYHIVDKLKEDNLNVDLYMDNNTMDISL